MKTTAERTRQVIADIAGCVIEQAADDKDLTKDLGLDSLDRYEMAIELEIKFGIWITNEEVEPCNTVAQIVALVEGKVKS